MSSKNKPWSLICTDGYMIDSFKKSFSEIYHDFGNRACQIKVGDTVEILSSSFSNLIGKKAIVSEIDSFGDVGVTGLPGYESSTYYISARRVKVVDSINIKESIVYSKPAISGANCSGCGIFNEYQTQEFTCFGCKNVQ
jgi:hypothetical protein